MAAGQEAEDIPPQYTPLTMNNHIPVINQTVVHQSNAGKYALTYKKSASLWIGSILIVCGVSSVIGGAMAIAFYTNFYFVGNGLWVGAVFLTAGGLSISAAKNPIPCLVHSSTAFAFIALVFGVIQTILTAIDLASGWHCPYCYYVYNSNYPYYYCSCWFGADEAHGANGLMLAAAAAAIIVSLCLGIINSQTVCDCYCCCDSTSQEQFVCIPIPCSSVSPGQFTGQPQTVAYYVNPQQPYQQPMYQLSAGGIQTQSVLQVMPQPLIITQTPATAIQNPHVGNNYQL